jgi:integrase
MLTIRKRGPVWYVRGTVQTQGRVEHVHERSTRETEERPARAYAEKLESEIRARLVLGISQPKAEPPPLLFTDAIARLLDVRDVSGGDAYRLEVLLAYFGPMALKDFSAEAWQKFCREKLAGRKPNTLARLQITLRQVFTYAGGGIEFPKMPMGAKRVELVRWLTIEQADRLVSAYPEHAQKIALFLRYQGTRTQETLQVQRPDIDLDRGPYGAAFIRRSKNGESRWVPLHPKVRDAIIPLLEEKRDRTFKTAKGDELDPVFLSNRHIPYADTRIRGMGSNPMRRAHVAACKRAGVTDFRPHDWRHHWATWCVREGMDLRTLQVLGGWRELSMVQRYAAVDMDHAAERLARLK